MSKALTISVAAYNVSNYLKETLDSLIVNECLDSLEVLIINDGSTDDTASIAADYVNKYPDTFILINKENGGWGSTVNAGIRAATGKYFKLLDGDDCFDTASLTDFIDFLTKCDADLVYTDYVVFDDESHEVTEVKKVDMRMPLGEVVPSDRLNPDFMLMMHACTFKTELLQRNNVSITEHCFYTDNEYVVKALVNVETVCMKDCTVYRYRVGREGQSVSWEGYKKHYLEHATVVEQMLLTYKSLSDSKHMRVILFDRIKWIIDVHYNVMLHLGKDKKYKEALLRFDTMLKSKYSEFYPTTRRKVKLFRLTKGLMFPLLVYKS